MRRTALRSVLILAALTVMLEARVESTRWWWSPTVIAALGLSPAQSSALDRAYERSIPVRQRLAERIVALTDRVEQLNDRDAADEELMPVTEQLAHAQCERGALRSSLIDSVDAILSPAQRTIFRRLLARKLVSAD
jgi:hypothetical protein